MLPAKRCGITVFFIYFYVDSTNSSENMYTMMNPIGPGGSRPNVSKRFWCPRRRRQKTKALHNLSTFLYECDPGH